MDNEQLLSDIASYLAQWLTDEDRLPTAAALTEALRDWQDNTCDYLSTADSYELEAAREEIERLEKHIHVNDDLLEAIASRLTHQGAPVRTLCGPDLDYIHEQFAKLEY